MPICREGEVLTIPVEVHILKSFAHEDRVYYIAKPLKSLIRTFWVVSNDGEPLEVDEVILKKAYKAMGRI